MTDFSRKFGTKEKKQLISGLILSGRSYLSIAQEFGCNHTSVIYYARKLGIQPRERLKKIKYTDDECINTGHSYKDIMGSKGYKLTKDGFWVKDRTFNTQTLLSQHGTCTIKEKIANKHICQEQN